MTQVSPQMDFLPADPDQAAHIRAYRHWSRDRANERDRIAEGRWLIDNTPQAEARALLDAEFARRGRGY